MKEFNINIEGYNVKGICVGCLNYNRKMFYGNEVKDVFKILGEINVPDGLSMQVCWECLAAAKRVVQFKQRILNSFDILINYSRNHPFLNCPNDLSQFASTNVSSHISIPLDTLESLISDEEIKEEIDEFKDGDLEEDVELGTDILDESIEDESYNDEDTFDKELSDNESSDDDTLLVELKIDDDDKKSKKKKEKKKTPKSQVSIKLKNLPEEIVELHTMDEEEMWSTRARDVANDEFVKFKRKCLDCMCCFINQKSMDRHFEWRHCRKLGAYVQCDVCKAFLVSKESMLAHRKKHLDAYKCRICGLVTTLKMIMSNHECAKRTETGHPCSICQSVFSTKSKLAYHRSICKGERPQCDCCGRTFSNKNKLRLHLRNISGTNTDKPVSCEKCGKVFHRRKNYKNHVLIHDGLTYPCPICGKLFRWKSNVAKHVRIHRDRESGIRHYCRDCGKTFSSRDSYTNHLLFSKNHANLRTRKYACQYCDKSFMTKTILVDHIDWEHLKRIKYRCKICNKVYRSAVILSTHMSNVHDINGQNIEPEGGHLCELCGKSYKTEKRLKGHVWAMHTQRSNGNIFECALCPATFTWKSSIYKHMRVMHENKRSKVKQTRARPTKKKES